MNRRSPAMLNVAGLIVAAAGIMIQYADLRSHLAIAHVLRCKIRPQGVV
jgi:hypothetical protein